MTGRNWSNVPRASRPDDPVERRKAEQLSVAVNPEVESKRGAGWADVHLVHQALPVTDLAEIDLSIEFLGRRLAAPLVIASMTGGHSAARELNSVLARAAERHGLAMGLGSQRAMLRKPELGETYSIAREKAPSAFLIANVGAAQLVPQGDEPALTDTDLLKCVSAISADAIVIHLNFLEESVQTEGDRRVRGLRRAIVHAIESLSIPVIAKETGAGLSAETAVELREMGFSALDVGGAGGTSFAAVEGLRAESFGDRRGAQLGRVYRDWGIPTAIAILMASKSGLPVIGTGGVRSGLDAAKALALGASLVGVARPLLEAALAGDDAVDQWITQFLEELRVAVFLTGGSSITDLQSIPRVILGETRRWVDDLALG